MKNVMDTLRERGFIKQTVYEDELYEKLGSESVPFYIGFDPTADSLHVGHFMQLIAMKHMQDAGHRPIILIGGGTGMIGDPSGRTDMRSMMTRETVRVPRGVLQKADGALYPLRRRERRHRRGQCRLAARPQLRGFPARRRRIFFRQQDAHGGVLPFAHGEGADLPRIQLYAHAGVRLPRAQPQVRLPVCSWAGTISGATFLRGPTSSAARSARRRLP